MVITSTERKHKKVPSRSHRAEEYNDWITGLYHIQNVTQNGFRKLYIRPEAVKTIKENTYAASKFLEIGLTNFWGRGSDTKIKGNKAMINGTTSN